MGGGETKASFAPIFKKRSRTSSTRKRRRSIPDEDDELDQPQLSREAASNVKSRSRSWLCEQYSANGEGIDGIKNATAERIDIGGEPVAKKKKPFGPMSAPTHIRTSVRIDYQQDVCKDYKETGYCGFGDACKFLHDRSDYKAGWQLDRDWAAKEKERRDRIRRGEDPNQVDACEQEENIDDDGLPFGCYLCRNAFKRPVVTNCGHYFCEDCAVSRMQAHSTCAICKTELSGTLNPAVKLQAKVDRLQISV